MHHHDPDLIMALAEGQLAAADASLASAEIAACPECTEDLEAQRIALAAMATLPAPAMTDIERQSLRTAVRDSLGLSEDAVLPAPVPRRRRWSPSWALGGAAAVLIAVVAAAPALQLLSPGGNDAADMAATTTAPVVAEVGESPEPASDSASASSVTDEAGHESVTTIAAAAETTTTAGSIEDQLALGTNPDEDLPDMLTYTQRAGGDPDLARQLNVKGFSTTTPRLDPSSCRAPEEAQLPDTGGFVVAAVVVDGQVVPVVAYVPSDVGDTVLVVFDPADCAVIYRAPPLD